MPKILVHDGNWVLHRALSTSGKFNNPDNLEKNALSKFLSMVCNVSLERRATHVLVCFDGPESFRKEIYSKYKANRGKKGEGMTLTTADGGEFKTSVEVGALVKPAKQILTLAGITYSHKRRYESDDLMASAARSLYDVATVEIVTGDKDLNGEINDRVKVYNSMTKQLLDDKAIWKRWGIKPRQMRDLLCLLGDAVDNIPGTPGFGPKTAQAFLAEYGSIKKALETKSGLKKLKPHAQQLRLAKALTTLRGDLVYQLEDLVISEFDPALTEHVWKIPESLRLLGDTRKAATIKGLFGRRK
jgi:DNA polymerase-1